MGTHARSGVERLFLGSVTNAVLRSTPVPVLTVRALDEVQQSPFACAVVAVDDSDAADAALAIGAILALDEGTKLIACHAIDISKLYLDAETFGLSIDELMVGLREEGPREVKRAFARAACPRSRQSKSSTESRRQV
jgi:nucleotide-binding universal stress UspA family protein